LKTTLKNAFIRLTPTQLIITGYFSAVIISTFLLLLPISLKEGVKLSLIDALFTATSAFTVTGLTVVTTADTFTVFGTFMIMIMLQLGGIGIMALGTFLWIILGRNISLSYRKLIMIDQNRHNLSGLVQLIRIVIGLALLFEAIGTLVLGVYFMISGYYNTWYEAFYYALFHSLSSFTNGGFDIFGGESIAKFSNDYFVQTVTMILLLLGAIGFPVLIEVREYLFGKHPHFRFSLFTKITVSMFFLLILLGAIGIWIVESQLYFADLPWHQKLFFSLFNSVTTRSGGLATMDVSQLGETSQILLSILMFIGASPSSVGGGIRTTTFAIIILTLITYALGKNEVRVFRKAIKQEDIIKSFVVFSAGTMIAGGSIMFLDNFEGHRFPLIAIIFEICSAFGTSGLSMGITSELSTTGKALIMALMFIGRIGILSLLFMFQTEKRKENYHYPKEDVIIG
jgi:potassium uptake TrkH family protein